MARKFCQALFPKLPKVDFRFYQRKHFSSGQSCLPGNIPTKIIQKTVSYKDRTLTCNINTVKVGHGPQAIFLLPGVLGSMEVQLMHQINGFDKNKYTVYAWDQPGYGQSRPPPRVFDNEALEQDAEYLVQLLKEFGHERWSLVGWSAGANVALLTAINYPSLVERLVVWGAFANVRIEDVERFKWFRTTKNWGGLMQQTLVEYYGYEFFEKEWKTWMDIFISYYTERSGEFCAEKLHLIQCPTYIIHGDRDGLIDQHHGNFLHKKIKNSKYHAWSGGKHNVHLRYPSEFNQLVDQFLSNGPVPVINKNQS